MKRIGKSDRVKETVQKRAYIPGVARNRSVVRPWRLAAPSGCAAKCGGLFGLGALLPSSVIPRGARQTHSRITRRKLTAEPLSLRH